MFPMIIMDNEQQHAQATKVLRYVPMDRLNIFCKIYIFSMQIWDHNEKGVWIVSASWKAHSGSVWRLSWAHPEFGTVLATCSFDRTVSVWVSSKTYFLQKQILY